jgi:hypothetical protein
MDINSLINITTGKVDLAVATNVLKKAQDIESTQAKQLLDALPKPSPSPQGVGQSLDIYA